MSSKCGRTCRSLTLCLHGVALWWSLSVLLAFAAWMGVASAATDSAASSFTVRSWTAADGLPVGTIQAFAQTADRSLWIGTEFGLFRFDGSTFQAYGQQEPHMPRMSVFALYAARDGALWIGTEGAGVYRLQNGQVESFATAQGLTNAFIRTIAQETSGAVWIGTDDGIFRSSGRRFVRMDNTAGFPAITVHAMVQAQDGAMWIGGSRLVRWKDGVAEQWVWGSNPAQTAIKSMLVASDGSLYLGCVNGLYRIRALHPSAQTAPEKIAGSDDTIRALHQTRSGALWMATSRHGVMVYEHGRVEPLPEARNVVGNTVGSILEDGEKNLWVGSQKGLARFHATEIAGISLPTAGHSDYGTLYEDPDGTLWFSYSGLYQYAHGELKTVSLPGIDAATVHTVFRERNGTLWLGTNGQGIYRVEKGVTHHYTIRNGLVNNFIRAVTQGPDGTVWIATDGGLSRWASVAGAPAGISNVLVNTTARDLLVEPNGDLWVATRTGIAHLHGVVVQKDEATARLRDEIVLTLCRDASGGIWFGTENSGILRWKNGRMDAFTRQQGLPTDRVQKILEDRAGQLWISSMNGVASIPEASFDAVLNHTARTLNVNVFSVEEELQSAQIYGSYPSSGLMAQDGHVWFAGMDGPIRIPQNSRTMADAPPVRIDAVNANGRSMDMHSDIRLSPGTSRVEFRYTAVLPQSPERIRYRYRLEGFDRDWSDPATEKTANYTNLPAGSYRFQVMAYDLNNPEHMTTAEVALAALPHFYRTAWFLSLCAVLLAGMIFAGHGMYVQQMRARYRGILQERARVARELHDTLIQGCTTVSALLEASTLTEGAASETLVGHARDQIRSTTEMARRVVWNLRNDEKAHEGFETTVESIVASFRRDFNLPVQCTITGRPTALSEEVEHEMRMVMREALYNTARHAQAKDVRVRIEYLGDAMTMELIDNGIGFDVDRVTASHSDHYGLRGIQERITRIGGEVRIDSRAGEGTYIAIHLPLGGESLPIKGADDQFKASKEATPS